MIGYKVWGYFSLTFMLKGRYLITMPKEGFWSSWKIKIEEKRVEGEKKKRGEKRRETRTVKRKTAI